MLNKVILMGRLVADPELRRTPNDITVTAFRIAVDRNYNKNAEQKQADFIDIVAWRRTAEFVCNYFGKGKMIIVVGSLQTRSWEDKQGQKRWSTEVVADEVMFGESKKDFEQSRNDAPRPAGNSAGFDPMAGMGGNAFASLPDDDNDLPF